MLSLLVNAHSLEIQARQTFAINEIYLSISAGGLKVLTVCQPQASYCLKDIKCANCVHDKSRVLKGIFTTTDLSWAVISRHRMCLEVRLTSCREFGTRRATV